MQLDDDARDAKQQFSLTNYLGQIMGLNGLKEKTEWIFKLRSAVSFWTLMIVRLGCKGPLPYDCDSL